jgi:hypothetical protein
MVPAANTNDAPWFAGGEAAFTAMHLLLACVHVRHKNFLQVNECCVTQFP